ncbi:MAG: LPS export ABC transporter permease LptG [Xanthobacteraceae bacterium]|nr:LPS export ABC transporter permease LptG [Xanthobacteraceae bacterium]QYK46000.1 MAG: LPS export ABC transporter permease LptG [Xanthobacteraceae bacterium]
MVAFGLLGRYFGRRFLMAVLVAFTTCMLLIAVVDFFELTRRVGDRPDSSVLQIAYLVLLRLPAFSEQMLPFAVLVGAMSAFLALSRRLEFVIARASGMSAWQFIGSAVAIAFFIGILATTVYNPLSATLKEHADNIEATLVTARSGNVPRATTRSNIWLRQRTPDGAEAIINAQAGTRQGRSLTGLRIFTFDPSGEFAERIEAKTAELEDGFWRLTEVSIYSPTKSPQFLKTHNLPTSLTANQVRGSFANAASISFWELPLAIELVQAAGLTAANYRIQYQVLLARPLLLATMVIIAAAVSLRIFRLGGVGKMVTGGVLAGFLLYVAVQLSEQLGEGGFLHPVVAGWLPIVCAALIGCSVLLNQEDG